MGKFHTWTSHKFNDFQLNNCIFLNIIHLKNIILQEKFMFQHIVKNLQILAIFGKLIKYLHVYNIHLEKSALDNSMVQPPATKKVRILLIFGEIICNLSNEFQGKIIS